MFLTGNDFLEDSPYEPVNSRLSDIFRLAPIIGKNEPPPPHSPKPNPPLLFHPSQLRYGEPRTCACSRWFICLSPPPLSACLSARSHPGDAACWPERGTCIGSNSSESHPAVDSCVLGVRLPVESTCWGTSERAAPTWESRSDSDSSL